MSRRERLQRRLCAGFSRSCGSDYAEHQVFPCKDRPFGVADRGISAAVSYDATLSSKSDTDNGWLAEIAVPRSAVNVIGGKLKLNFALFDVEGGEDAVVSTGEKNPQYWITVSGL